MSWRPDFAAAESSPELDPLRRAVGQLILDRRIVGYVATEAHQIAAKSGWLWWRSWSVEEFIALAITRQSDDSPLPERDDPWWFPGWDASRIADLAGGRLDYPDARTDSAPDVCYQVRWLTGDEFEDAWRNFGPEPPLA